MTLQQQENLAKYLYDISKLILVVAVLTPIVQPERFRLWIMISGFITTFLTFLLAYFLDGRRKNP